MHQLPRNFIICDIFLLHEIRVKCRDIWSTIISSDEELQICATIIGQKRICGYIGEMLIHIYTPFNLSTLAIIGTENPKTTSVIMSMYVNQYYSLKDYVKTQTFKKLNYPSPICSMSKTLLIEFISLNVAGKCSSHLNPWSYYHFNLFSFLYIFFESSVFSNP